MSGSLSGRVARVGVIGPVEGGVIAPTGWTVNGSKVRLDVPAAIPRFLAADKLHTCTTKYFAVLRQARGGKLTASVEQTDLQRAL